MAPGTLGPFHERRYTNHVWWRDRSTFSNSNFTTATVKPERYFGSTLAKSYRQSHCLANLNDDTPDLTNTYNYSWKYRLYFLIRAQSAFSVLI